MNEPERIVLACPLCGGAHAYGVCLETVPVTALPSSRVCVSRQPLTLEADFLCPVKEKAFRAGFSVPLPAGTKVVHVEVEEAED
jgi:hypothetical protein